MPELPVSLDRLEGLCRRAGLACKTNLETGELAVLYRILDEDCPLYIAPDVGRGMVRFMMPLPFRVPPARLAFVADAVMRLNGAARMGGWVQALDAGEASFRVVLPTFGADYTDDGLLFVVRLVVAAVNAAAADLRQIALGDRTSAELWPRAASVPCG